MRSLKLGEAGALVKDHRTGIWRFRYFDPRSGATLRRSTGETDFQRALEAQAQFLREFARSITTPFYGTYNVAAAKYIDTVKNDETRRQMEGALVRWHPYIGTLRLMDITEDHVRDFIDEHREAGLSESTIRVRLSFLVNVFRSVHKDLRNHFLDAWQTWVGKSAVIGYPVSRPEEDRVLAALEHPWQRRMVVFAVETGLRRSELEDLVGREVTAAEKYLWVRDGKGGKDRMVPLTPRALAVLSEIGPRGPDERVFEHTIQHRWWGPARETAGLPKVRWHDLRHTFGTRWVRDGGEVTVLQKVMGHASITMTMRYVKLAGSDLIAGMEKVAKYRASTVDTSKTETEQPALQLVPNGNVSEQHEASHEASKYGLILGAGKSTKKQKVRQA